MQQAKIPGNGVFTNSSASSGFIQALYKGAQEKSLSEFKSWVFAQLHGIVDFDEETWDVRSAVSRLNLNGWHKDICLSDQYFKLESESLTFVTIGHNAEMCHKLRFHRNNYAKAFSDNDIQLLQFLMPNIIGAFRINLLNSFEHHDSGDTDQTVLSAVVDNCGTIVEADDAFEAQMTKLKLMEHHKVKLDLSDHSHSQPRATPINGHTIKTTAIDGDMFGIDLIEQSPLSQLSKRKKEISGLVVQGLTDKEIGRKLDISHNTVSNHLKEVYKLLKVTSRPAAIAYLSNRSFE
ncbi:MAG: helix-turn-helix transcriptional regulator [Psychrosphaera sp.]|nr:helix-turn-helix transcriptional regulator [Psychrosphaera sp.]